MAAPVIDAVAVSSTDLTETVAFYRCLGFRLPDPGPEDRHIEAEAEPGAVRLMIDAADLMEELTGQDPRPATHSGFALKCADAAEVDAVAARVKAAGFTLVTAPWDAFWGQRYATVADPDGYQMDLFAPL